MDSQLALVLTNGSLDNANGSQHLEKLANKATVDPWKNVPLGSSTGILQPCAILRAVTSMGDGLPDVGGTSRPASQEMGESGGFKQPIIVKTCVPLMRNQPIRIKIVVPPRCKGPNSNSPASVTKNPPNIQFITPVAVSAGTVLNGLTAETNTSKTAPVLFSVLSDKETKERKNTQEPKAESCPGMVAGEENQRHVTADQTGSANTNRSIVSQTAAPSTSNPPSLLGQPGTPGARAVYRVADRPVEAEQTEPLDLSLPRRIGGNAGRCSRFLDDSGCSESSLIMEVDEYEGEGDRDVVEEDDDDALGDSLLSPALLPASPPPTALHHDDNKLLLIDDQGIPYTLSSDGHKVPQINPPQGQDPPPAVPVVPPSTAEVRGAEIPRPATLGGSDPDQGFASTLHAPGATPASIDDSSSAGDELPEAAAVTSTQLPASPLALEPCAGSANEASAALSQPPGAALPGQPNQILSTSSSSAPILLLATSSTTSSSSLSISTGTFSPVLLLLSSVLSSSDQPLPLAVLDPHSGQLSQLTSHPVIRVGPNHGPVILSGAGASVSPLPPPSVSPCPPAPTAPLHAETKAMSAGESPDEDAQPSPPATTTPSPPSPRPTFVPSDFNRSPSPEPTFDPPDLHSEPLEDHLYFSSSAAPPTPPAPPSLSSGQLDPPDPLDPLDPLSPAASPSSMGPRRVLYCQLCPRVFFYLSDLERHAITHSQKKPHVCQQCGKAFKRSSHLQRHKHIHTGQRNYVCPICAKRFREAGELQRHQRVHTGEKPYQCQLCHTRFAERNTLRRHTKRKHPFHQVAMEMLSERRGGGSVVGGGGVMQEEEESAEWYSSTVSNFDDSESEMDT